jgi:kumamolisin
VRRWIHFLWLYRFHITEFGLLAMIVTGSLCAAALGGIAFATDYDDTGRAEAIAHLISPIAANRPLHLAVMLKLRDRAALDELISQQQDRSSPNYRRWLTPTAFASRFGPTKDELDRVRSWLIGQGFTIDSITLGNRMIRVHTTAAHAASAFGLKFAASADGRLFGNLNDPRLPEAIAPLIDWIGGLDNLKAQVTHAHRVTPRVDINDQGNAFGPPDIYSFYDETALLGAGPPINGSNTDCVAIIEDSNFDQNSTDVFNTQFSLPAFNYSLATGTNFQMVYADSTDPGINADEIEALLDLQYVHALAPGANIVNYIGDNNSSSTGLGFLDAAFDAIDQNQCGTISISYGICGVKASFFKEADSVFAQGAAQGQSIFVASGDEGAASLKFSAVQDACVVGHARGVEGLESSPNVTSVGGTMFSPNYDESGDNTGNVPEVVWKDFTGAGSGGRSPIFKKPGYQKGVTRKDSSRDVPDIAFGASPVYPGFYFGYSPISEVPSTVQCCIGGTSVGAPSWAGISMLIQQELGKRPGLINSHLYQLGRSEASAGLRDVTSGNNSFNGVRGYKAVAGYDQATGWGTPDIADFVAAFIAP